MSERIIAEKLTEEELRAIADVQYVRESADYDREVEAALEADREKGLRDAFAGGALSALIAVTPGASREKDLMARQAYAYADAMMRARKS